MQVLSTNDYKLFRSLVKLNQKSMMKTLNNYLEHKYDNVIHGEGYIYAEGDIPIALIAHMDTVFNSPPRNIYYDTQQGVIWSPEGLGADDRAGIFAILKIIQSGLRPSVIFTEDEEIGGIGAISLTRDFPKSPPTELNYIIELDRRGTNDCVFYDCANEDFIKYVESFGFIENFGSFSDISEICPIWGIAGVNLSIGYEDEHSYTETFHIKPWLTTIKKVQTMLQEEYIPFFKFIYNEKSYWMKNFSKYNWDYDESTYKCHICGKTFSEYEMIPVVRETGKIDYFCPDCCVDNIQWCTVCGNAFEATDKRLKYCPECYKHKNGGKDKKCNSTKKFKKTSTK